ncbi:thymidine kinase [Turneriella parva]|uniref:Thymidine kinase n=1 Tax=Turneriella parva (strain ATCC BAA-1111 / DSM 21527 / NCTC 11395 / H) TaxID=869212 RepID=I4B6D9_TURPD|nr:thymidine kinase [Turneriella parva]AFM12846.1 thymidine kinase [Turneriella parva DSM 21527]
MKTLQPDQNKPAVGKISVIHGPMFSGKTEELLRRVRRAKIARKKVQLFKPAIDNRYHATQVLPHFLAQAADESVQVGEAAHVVSHPREIAALLKNDTDIAAIEEAQFLDDSLIDLVRRFSRQGIDVILSLLDQDYRRLPFPIAPAPGSESGSRNVGEYLAIAHESLKLAAICVVCGQDAHHSQKLTLSSVNSEGKPIYKPASFFTEVVTVGTSQELTQNKLFAEKPREFPESIYEARCRYCHVVADEPQ